MEDCLRVLTSTKYRSDKALNTFWNLDYDVASMFKYETDKLIELYETTKTIYEGYKLEYLPDKQFVIKNNKKKWVFYDIQQFYKEQTPSLEVASKRYLGKDVDVLKGDRARLYDMYPIERIGVYCAKDAILTKELTDYLLNGLKDMGVYPKDLMSVGSISRQYCIENSNIPKIHFIPPKIIDAYYQAYRGGWFECQKRGYMNVWDYDIVSAYPVYIRDLPDIRDIHFESITCKDEIAPGDQYGVILVEYYSLTDTVIQPLSLTSPKDKAVMYPRIDIPVTKWITLREYIAYQDIYNFNIIKGWVVRNNLYSNPRYPFKNIVDELYKTKEKEKSEGRKGGALYMASKLILNSVYGNTAQTTDTKEGLITGGLFNPFYASEITAGCRVQVFEAIKDQLQDVVMISTDGIMTDKPLNRLSLGDKLGDWELVHENKECIIHSNGVYHIKGEKCKSRGFRKVDFFKDFNINSDILTIHNKKDRVRPKKALKEHRALEINHFIPTVKDIQLMSPGIKRRLWDDNPETFKDLLNNKYSSMPHNNEYLSIDYDFETVTPYVKGDWEKQCKYIKPK